MVDTVLAQGCTLAYSSQASQPFPSSFKIPTIALTIDIRHLPYNDLFLFLFLILILVRLLVASSAYSCRSDGGGIHGGRRRVEPYLGIAGWITPPSCLGITPSPVDRILIDSSNSCNHSHLAKIYLNVDFGWREAF